MIGERPNKKNIESFDYTQKVNLLRLWRGKYFFFRKILERDSIKKRGREAKQTKTIILPNLVTSSFVNGIGVIIEQDKL